MKKIYKKDLENRIVQVTIADERWYCRLDPDGKEQTYVPSVTWIAGHYPKGIGFYKWLSSKSWDEGEAIKIAAGDKGSRVHQAVVDLIDGKEIEMEAKYLNANGKGEELTLEEYDCIMSFRDWFLIVKPKIIAREIILFNDKDGYAGTMDFVCEIKGEVWIIDFKTGQSIWPEHEIQISAYKQAWLLCKKTPKAKVKLGILQLGYWRTKKKYKFTEVEDKFDLFLHAKAIWANETKGVEPKKKDYPVTLTLKEVEK